MRILVLLLLVPALAGCTEDGPERFGVVATFEFDGLREPLQGVVYFHEDHFPAAETFRQDGAEHPSYLTAFDVVVEAGAQIGFTYRTSYGQYGHFLDDVAGYPGQGSYWWQLHVNGVSSGEGMSSAAVAPGDDVLWALTPF